MLVEVSLTIIVLEFVHPIHVSHGGDVDGECDGIAYNDGIVDVGEDKTVCVGDINDVEVDKQYQVSSVPC